MRKFSIPCLFGAEKSPFDFYIGHPTDGMHPLQFQAAWLLEERSGIVPPEVMESFTKLLKMARENEVDFEELCSYAVQEVEKMNNPPPGEVSESSS